MSRILIIGSWPRSLINFRGNLIDELLNRKHDVFACAGGKDRQVSEWFNNRGSHYYSLPLERTGINPFKDLVLIIWFIKLILKIKPDIVVGYTIKPVVYGLIAAKICRVKRQYALITGLGSTFLKARTFRQKVVKLIVPRMYKLALKNNTNVFFQNKDDRDVFISNKIIKKESSYSITNGSGVDTDFFQIQPLPQRDLVFLMVARLLKDKGIMEYIEAARRLKKKYPKIEFKVLGPLDDNPSAISFDDLKKLKDKNMIDYLGETDDVRPYVRDASVVVLPSYREGMPRSVLEAMSMGRAIITTDVPGCRETVIDKKNGFLITVKNVDELVIAMENFISSNNLASTMGKVSREIVESKFDVRLINNEIIKVMKL